jgi:hypothetical protein
VYRAASIGVVVAVLFLALVRTLIGRRRSAARTQGTSARSDGTSGPPPAPDRPVPSNREQLRTGSIGS